MLLQWNVLMQRRFRASFDCLARSMQRRANGVFAHSWSDFTSSSQGRIEENAVACR
jgi:hypothetical protein